MNVRWKIRGKMVFRIQFYFSDVGISLSSLSNYLNFHSFKYCIPIHDTAKYLFIAFYLEWHHVHLQRSTYLDSLRFFTFCLSINCYLCNGRRGQKPTHKIKKPFRFISPRPYEQMLFIDVKSIQIFCIERIRNIS